MGKPFLVELSHVQSLGGDRTPAFRAQLELDGREVAHVECDGLGGPPILLWHDPQGEDAEALDRWRVWCHERAESIYGAALGVQFPACRDRQGVDWIAEELAVFELYDLHQTRDDIELRRRGAKA